LEKKMAECESGCRRIKSGEIKVGEPLPWSVADGTGVLLLREGYVISSLRQIDTLISRGVYQVGDAQNLDMAQTPSPPTSPFHRFDDLQNRLKRICEELKSLPDGGKVAPERITSFCSDLQQLCSFDGDAVLAAIHLIHEGRYSVIHALHSAILAEVLLDSLNVAEGERISILAAALTQNVGSMELHDNWCKQAEPLSAEQRIDVHRHPRKSVEILEEMGVKDRVWLNSVLHHHERLDGSGYPDGIMDKELALPVRVISIVDIYCALVKPRAYRPGLHALDALRELFLKRAGNVDERITKLFIKELGVFPPGAFVRLNNGDIGIVTHRGKEGSPPAVCSVIGPRGAALEKPLKRDTTRANFSIKEIVNRDKNLNLSLHALWGYA
jgi:HD-GYP domain-containing protein (c-di-GMP phosphodiesterase class II)